MQVHQLKRVNEDQRQEMLRMIEAHARVQQAAAEMNRLRFTATRNILTADDIDSLSQQLSQIPKDFTDHGSPAVSSPVSHRSKRSRLAETPKLKTPRAPLSTVQNRINIVSTTARKSVKMAGETQSSTQDEEGSPIKKVASGDSEYGDLIPDEEGFSQFDM